MKLPAIRGIIDRRILANYRIDAEVMADLLPAPFRPKRVGGFAIGGICLIRLRDVRPRFFPLPCGIRSENAAHRIAVEWETEAGTQEGVYISRRDTNSKLNHWAGGTVFPGEHHHAVFEVVETDDTFSVSLRSDDGDTRVRVVARSTDEWPRASAFSSLDEASRFFERGSLGYSETAEGDHYDGLELRCQTWQATPLAVEEIESSYFDDATRFPQGSVQFDCALLMQSIDHEWHGREDLCCPAVARDEVSADASSMPAG